MVDFDYIIVGAGAALALLAGKLQSMSQDIAAHASKTAGRRQWQHAVPGRREL